MDNLVVGLGNLRLDHQFLEDIAVLHLADSQDSVPDLVLVLHGADDLCHVVEFLAVLHLGPLVGALRKVLIIVFTFVVISVKQVLEIVKADHMTLLHLLRPGEWSENKDGGESQDCAIYFSH